MVASTGKQCALLYVTVITVTCANASVSVCNRLARAQCVFCAAVRALGATCFGNVKVDLGVCVPHIHVGGGVGAVHTAVLVEVGGA